jgi:outer membrane protein OmpA-like peptidoglycan-associated protein
VAGPAATNGCPDGDGDGVADAFDNCPTEKGEAANQGCPAAKKQLVVITKDALKILDKVQFASGKATILPKSFPLLDQVASVLKSQTQIKLVQVEGHTDNVGKPEANTKLSQQRADAVVDYLVKKGVEKARLKAVGFGQEKPVQSNDTAAGKEANRRVEFNIVAQ